MLLLRRWHQRRALRVRHLMPVLGVLVRGLSLRLRLRQQLAPLWRKVSLKDLPLVSGRLPRSSNLLRSLVPVWDVKQLQRRLH